MLSLSGCQRKYRAAGSCHEVSHLHHAARKFRTACADRTNAMNIATVRTCSRVACAALIVFAIAAPARAQYKPRPLNDPATGELFHIEADASVWSPGATMPISSEALGIQGTTIDLEKDLGITDQTFPALDVQLRPARSHHFRLQYIPIKFEGSNAHLSRDIVFNGIRYSVNA